MRTRRTVHLHFDKMKPLPKRKTPAGSTMVTRPPSTEQTEFLWITILIPDSTEIYDFWLDARLAAADMATTIPYHRDSPFLHRVWKTAVEQMSIKLSAAVNGDKLVGGDRTPKLNKRRRITEDAAEISSVTCLAPQFHEPPSNFERALRIDVLKIGRAGGPVVVNGNGLLNGDNGTSITKEMPLIRARCKITIFRWKAKVEMRVLHCDTQICSIKMIRDQDNFCRSAEVLLPRPFHIAADKIYIERDDDQGFNLADRYLIQAELESAGDPNWPPLELLSGHELVKPSSSPARQWVLSSQLVYTYDKTRHASNVKLRKNSIESPTTTDMTLDIDLRWSSPNMDFGATARSLEDSILPGTKGTNLNGALEPLTNGHVNGRVEHFTNGEAKDSLEAALEDDEDGGDAHTPSRARRRTQQPQSYNLKHLSDKARGKERKERKKRKRSDGVVDSSEVTWLLPSNNSVILDNWGCIRCFGVHSSFEHLKLHLVEGRAHPEFKFCFDYTFKGLRRVIISTHGQETPRSMGSSELLESLSFEDQESESGEDDSPRKARSRSRPRLAHQRPVSVKPREFKQLIPKCKQPLFDRLSKIELQQETSVDEPQVDNTWLLHKHRDIIQDYSDLHSDEKEYITAWDEFAIREKSSLGPHMQRVYLDFMHDKASWLIASQSRMNEAMKHLAYLKARDAITEHTTSKALQIIKDARLAARHGLPESLKNAKAPPKEPSHSGCLVCGLPASGPFALICSNLDCERPFYHLDCIREHAKIPVEARNWQCDDCYENEKGAQE